MQLSYKETHLTDLKFSDVKQNEAGQDVFTFEGYASTFGNVDFDGDVIEKGAFEASLLKRTPKLLLLHNSRDLPLGILTEVREDDTGLFVKAEMPLDDDRVRGGVMPLMKQGALSDMSIGFTVGSDETIDGIRHISEVELFEVSLVTFPANPEAQVTGTKDWKALAATLSPGDQAMFLKELQPADTTSDERKAAEAALDALDDEERGQLVATIFQKSFPKITADDLKAFSASQLEERLSPFVSNKASSDLTSAWMGRSRGPAKSDPPPQEHPADTDLKAAADRLSRTTDKFKE